MYSREKVELFLLATEDGMGPTAAAKFAGVSVGAAKKWATGHLPHSYTGARCRIGARKPPRKEASLGPDKSTYAPPATGPLAGLNEDQIENLLLRAVLADLKAEGWDPASISNRSKCELGERLRRATALPLRSITGFLRISKSSYEYWRPRVAAPRDRDADIRDRVVRIFREGSGCWGYRTVWARLRREGVRASEKRVARVMREEGLEVVYNKRRAQTVRYPQHRSSTASTGCPSPGRSGCTPTSASRTRACSRPARRGRRARARRSTRTGAATTAGRSGSGSARRTA